MYIVVVGAGNIGTPLIEIATVGRNEVVVVEKDERKAEAASRNFDCLVIEADATAASTLEEAGIGRADALISTTDQDATNVMVSLLATEYEVPFVVSVVHDPEHMTLFERIGVTTMENPQRLIAEYLYRSVSRPSIKDYMKVGETAEVFEITVGEDAPLAEMTLSEATESGVLDDDMLVVAIERNGTGDPITPRGNTRLEPGDLATVYAGTGATRGLTDKFGHHEDHDY